MNTTVITTVRGRHQHLHRMREGLAAAEPAPDRHVVVSMGDPQAGNAAAEVPGPLQVIVLPCTHVSLPLAAARNRGAAAAGDAPDGLLVFLDVDCIPSPGLIGAYADAARQRPDDLLCGPVAYLPEGPLADHSAQRLAQLSDPHPARPAPEPGQIVTDGDHRLFWSLSFALRRETWERVGGFDEAYTGYGAEDTDFAFTAREAGVSLSWVGGARAFHQHHPVSDPPVEHLEDILANGKVFARKWGHWPMEGWLQGFEQQGLISRDGEDWVLSRTEE